MDEGDWLAERFEENRPHLRAVAYRMLGSLAEADDAVQEAWLRLRRSDTSGVENIGGWLTTVVARVCLNMLQSRRSRREEIAPVVGLSPAAARQLASRARRRVKGAAPVPDPDLARQREVVDAFLAAARSGSFETLLAVIDPDVVLRADVGAVPAGVSRVIRGAPAVAEQALAYARRLGPFARPALVNGAAGVVAAPGGRPVSVLGFTVTRGKIVEIDILADPERLSRLDLAELDEG